MLCSPCLEQLVNGVPNAISNCKLYYLIDEVVPQQFLYLEDQTNVLKEEDYKARFMEVIHYEILINRNKWRPGSNSKNGICISKWLKTLSLIALTMNQRKDDAYKNMIQNLSNKKLLAEIHKALPYTREEIQQGKCVPSGYIWKKINPSLVLKSWF